MEIKIKNLTKKYDKTVALDNVSLQFESGKIYGLLGSNGAGKTTLINILSNRVFPTCGNAELNSMIVTENEEAQKHIFCITEKSKNPSDIKIKKLFEWEKRFHENFDVEYAHQLAKKYDLDVEKTAKQLSTGYSTILKTIITLASFAPIMILDEPVLGIDSLYREIFYDVLLEHHKKAKNLIIISTHLIDEVERVLDSLVIIHKGKILIESSIEDLNLNGKRLNERYVDILKGATYAKI